ncbi:hypothetical protein M3J09_002797 [Ascochyta lentis]
MPPKATAHKTYSADVVAAVLMATGTTSLSMKHYEVMSSLDGVKTASAFQHDFRDVLAKAKELKARIDEGEVFEPVQPTKKRGGTATPASSKKRKGDDADDTPTKKPKAAAKPRGKKAQAQTEHPQTPQADDDDLPDDMEDFIKSEKQWEDEHIV